MKKLAFLLAICLLAAMLPVPALAEETALIAGEANASTQEVEAGADIGAEGLVIEFDDESDDGGSPEPADEESGEFAVAGAPLDDAAPAEDPQDPADAGTGIDYTRDMRFSPAFLAGYALTLAGVELADDDGNDAGIALPAETVVYAYDRNLEDRLKVAVDAPEGVAVGWLDAEVLRPMSPEEADAFVAAALAAGARCFDAEGTLPLAKVGAAEPADGEGSADPAADPDAETEPPAVDAAPAPEDDAGDPSGDGEADGDGDGDAEQPIHIDPDGPQLKKNEITLGEGETFALAGVMPDGSASAICYSVDDEAVATVSEAGVVTAVSPGEARVRAESEGGAWSECQVRVLCQPDAVRFEKSTYYIGKGETYAGVRVIVGSEEGRFAGGYTLISGNRTRLRIGANGTIYGRKTGTVTLTVRTYNGLTAKCRVKVRKAPAWVRVYASRRVLGVGEDAQLTYRLSQKSSGRVTYVSSQPDVVSVDAATGAIYAVAEGTARLTAVTYNGRKASVTVTVKAAPQALTLTPETIVLGAGMRGKVVPVLDDGAAGAVTYASGDESIVTVAAEGTLKGVAPGETVIYGETYNGVPAQRAVVVKPAPEFVSLPWKTLYIGLGESVRLQPDVGDSASTFTYKSSNKRYVRVNGSGVIYGRKKGSATITVRTYNGKYCKLKVVVRKAPGWISVRPASADLCVGETVQLSFARQKNSAGAVTYSSGDESVAVVDPKTGLVTAVGAGRTTITARSYNKRAATCQILVYTMPEWINADAGFVQLGAGQTFDIKYELSPGSRSPVTFSSEDEDVASVDADGRIYANAPGSTAVTLMTNAPGVTATVIVTVLPAPDRVTLSPASPTLNVDETCRLVPSVPEGTLTSYSFASSDDDIARVSSDGTVLAVNRGTATLTVTTHNGKSASVTLTVLDPWYPEGAALLNAPEQLKIGETWQLEYEIYPSWARPRLQWSSGNPAVATVDQNGLITTKASGYATIRAVSAKNSDVQMQFTLAVQMPGIAMVIPARTTDIDGIPGNLAKIQAIRATAIAQINALQSKGTITSADATRRRSMVNSIFADYAFPWMTPTLQKYWKAANSEGGAKDFKPGIVYYGMPYISGSGTNRSYNSSRAVSEGRYTRTGDGYYLLNRSKLLNGKYVGSDCSGLVSQAIWGTTSGLGVYRTCDIDADNSHYKTIKDSKSMRPGDLLCKPYGHVIMFLYYTDPGKTQMMIIENGGSEAGTNTVHCSVMYVSSYLKKGYKIRRLKTLG